MKPAWSSVIIVMFPFIRLTRIFCNSQDLRKTTEIEDAFLSYFVTQDDYRIFAGFNQEVIESGIGYVEEIHVFISYKPPQLISLLSRLETICSPFPVAIFTPTSIHRLPSWSSVSVFTNNPNSKAGHGFPLAISLSCSSPGGLGETVKSNGPGESNRKSGSENKKGKERREEGDRPYDRPVMKGRTNRTPDHWMKVEVKRVGRLKSALMFQLTYSNLKLTLHFSLWQRRAKLW